MSDEMTFTLNSPLTEEEWDMIADVDFDHTSEITFHTKHGKEVVFVKRKKGKWIRISPAKIYECSLCGQALMTDDICAYKHCHGCGADMREPE